MSTPSKTSVKDTGNLIALSRYSAQMNRSRRSRRADVLFAERDPAIAIRALPPDEFFYVVHELGFPDALDVLVHGTPEQVQGALDFAVWDRGQVVGDRVEEWLEAMVQAPFETLGAWVRGMDIELFALVLRRRAHVYDLSLEEAPEEPQGTLYQTPDRLFSIDLLGDEQTQRTTERLLDNLYRYSPDSMRRILVGARSDTDAELEEMAYRWRSGRMADFGFIDFYEALAVYQELDPVSVQVGEGTSRVRSQEADQSSHLRLPAVMADRLTGSSPFARAVGSIQSKEEVAELHYALVALCNRALSADRVEPGDDAAVVQVLERVACTLDLAIEFLAHADDAQATSAIRTIPLVRLFRLGFTLTSKLRKLAVSLSRANPFASLQPDIDLFEPEDAEVLSTLSKPRPLFPRVLETPPAAGERPFAALVDLAKATAAVERAGASMALLRGLGLRAADLEPGRLSLLGVGEPAALDAGLLARTLLVRRLLGQEEGPLAALSGAEIAQFEQGLADHDHTRRMVERAAEILREAAPGRSLSAAGHAVATRWIGTLAPLGPVLRR